MSNSKLQAARELIKEKNYPAARAILETMPEDPTAKKWLAKLDELAPKTHEVVHQTQAITFSQTPTPKSGAEPDQTFLVLCPKCDIQSPQGVHLKLVEHNFVCPQCSTAFKTNFYAIRSSRSNGYESYRRRYSVRVIGANGERELTFSTQKGLRMELRSKDFAGFTYLDGTLKVVQNFTIRKYWHIKQASVVAWIIAFVCIVLFLILYAGLHIR